MKVILATDGSQHAEEAAWMLAHLPHSDKLELTVVYVSNTVRLQGSIVLKDLMKQFAVNEKARAETLFQHLNEVFEGANV
ncbi:MAG: universal stress protein [Pirellulaceae bacterium]|nr:universal stress protein [Pirellulaceae bacterium]